MSRIKLFRIVVFYLSLSARYLSGAAAFAADPTALYFWSVQSNNNNPRGGVIESVNEMVPTLHSLLENKTKINAMQSVLSRAVLKLVYGLGEEFMASGDAFDEMLGELERYISQLDKRRTPGGRKFYKFCSDCIWSGMTTCAGRVQFIVDTYGETDRTSITEKLVAQKPQCRTYKGDEDNAAAESATATYEFCYECVWTPGTSCGERVTFLSDEYGKDWNTTMINVAAKRPQCRRNEECKQ